MITYFAKRVGSSIVLLIVVSLLTFTLLNLTGGISVARGILGPLASDEQVQQRAEDLGLLDPFFIRFGSWLLSAVQGDLGRSWFTSESVTTVLASRLPVTLTIAVTTVLVTAVLSTVLGVAAAVYRGWVDRVVQIIAVVGFALPGFWVALVLVSTLAVGLGIFPATGYIDFTTSPAGWLSTITLPVTSLAIGSIAATAQILRGSLIDVLGSDFVRTLRAAGVPESRVLYVHALRNAAPPSLTVLSLQFIGLLGGTVIIEKVFALPGIGSVAETATATGDLPLVLGVVVLSVAIVIIVNLVIDLVNGFLNPKVRIS
ncbi:ABC transporter permease [Microbacterium sp. ZXX196]|uniref:ABC transporter permease n=1 Tax=Microbacterium sp. ZXX196 TaxID=2609291 RepID=UPI0012B70338|nr:ABC transporter permease [Microbacterium sp. ZXX196]MTE24897.1 ABC transporter permease subunit [Microbacterium sp. ZXX196]